MKIWNFRDPRDDSFALASRVGTWLKEGNPPRSVRVKPLVIEWEPSSTLVGDFTWAVPEFMLKQSVAEELLAYGFKGFEPGPVEMVPNRDNKRPNKNMISLPYLGPEVVDFWITKWISFDSQKSTVRTVGQENGKPVYDLEGIERIEHGKWDRTTGILERIHIPRTSGMGLYVNARELGDFDIFCVNDLRIGPCCTDRVRDFILKKKYTNITFFEMGETIA